MFLPHRGCPHRCIFCDQNVITSIHHRLQSLDEFRRSIDDQIYNFLEYKKHISNNSTQIAFYGGNFLGQHETFIKTALWEAQKYIRKDVASSIRFSTRPETLTEPRLELMTHFPVRTIEIGVQSMDDHVLSVIERGHSAADVLSAVSILKKHGYEIGVQLMTGLPGQDERSVMETTRRVIDLSPDMVRIYPTIVFKHSVLAEWLKKGRYHPSTLEETVHIVKKMVSLFEQNSIRVIRIGLQPTMELSLDDTIVAGPFHPAIGEWVRSEMLYDRIVDEIETSISGNRYPELSIMINPRTESKLRGPGNRNISRLKDRYGFEKIEIVKNGNLEENDFVIRGVEQSTS